MVYNVQCEKLCPLSKCSLRLLGLFGWASCLQRKIFLELDNIRCQGYIAAILVQVKIGNFLINYHYISAILPNDTYIVEFNGCCLKECCIPGILVFGGSKTQSPFTNPSIVLSLRVASVWVLHVAKRTQTQATQIL